MSNDTHRPSALVITTCFGPLLLWSVEIERRVIAFSVVADLPVRDTAWIVAGMHHEVRHLKVAVESEVSGGTNFWDLSGSRVASVEMTV